MSFWHWCNSWFRAFEFKRAKSAEKSEFLEISEISENIFPRFYRSEFSILHWTIPKTENSELKFDQNALRSVYIDQKTSIKVSNYL